MRRILKDLKIMLLANLWIVPVLAGLFFALFYFVAPPPPMHASLATGSPSGGYHAFGVKLRDELAKEGFTLTLVPSSGSLDNLRKLQDNEVQLALIQSGQEQSLNDPQQHDLVSLGVMYQEPLWLFVQRDVEARNLQDLNSLAVGIGTPSSGSGAVLRELLHTYQIDQPQIPEQWQNIGGNKAAQALVDGELQAAFFIGPAENDLIQRLSADSTLRLMSLPHTAAYQARLPHLNSLQVPEGMLNLRTNTPDQPIQTLGPVASLIANHDFHPSLTPLILAAAREVLKDGSLLDKPGTYPAPSTSRLPMLDEADYFYKKGLPILQRYLPFRIASLADRYIILAIPLLVLLFPLFKAIGPIYQWRIRARIYRWYKHLNETERNLHKGRLEDLSGEIIRLKGLEGELAQIQVPLSYSNELYQLHMHMRYMIQRLEELQRTTP